MIDAALLDMFNCPELTHPVELGAGSTRGYFDDQAVPMQDDFGARLIQERTLYVRTGTLPAIATSATLRMGPAGADAVGGSDPTYTVREFKPIQDGKVTAVILVPVTLPVPS